MGHILFLEGERIEGERVSVYLIQSTEDWGEVWEITLDRRSGTGAAVRTKLDYLSEPTAEQERSLANKPVLFYRQAQSDPGPDSGPSAR